MVNRRWRHDELGVAAAQAHVDRAGREIERDLGGGSRDRVQQDEARRRFERGGEPAGDDPGVIAARLGGQLELVAQLLDVRRQIHDVTMTSLRRQGNVNDVTMTSRRGYQVL